MTGDNVPKRGSFLEIEQSQGSRLEALRSSETDTGMLARLVEMSCLLELSKLSTARLDLAGYAQACIAVLQQFVPVVSCALCISVRDVPEVRVSSGGDGADLVADDHLGGYGGD